MTVRRRARIRVLLEGSHNTYVSKRLNLGGFVLHTDDPSDFLQVEYIPSFITGTQALYIPDVSSLPVLSHTFSFHPYLDIVFTFL